MVCRDGTPCEVRLNAVLWPVAAVAHNVSGFNALLGNMRDACINVPVDLTVCRRDGALHWLSPLGW